MAGQRHANDGIHAQARTARTRRGILAAAAAVVAGLAAKQVAEPVAATDSSLQYPSSGTTTATNTATGTTVLTGAFDGDLIQVKNTGTTRFASAIFAQTDGVICMQAQVTSASTGSGSIVIDARQSAPSGSTTIRANVDATVTASSSVAVDAQNAGTGNSVVAVRGLVGIGAGSSSIGVHGTINGGTSTNTIAVSGTNFSTGTGGIGVSGKCDVASGVGVQGSSTAGIGVLGTVPSGSAAGTVAIKATNASTGNGGIGVFAVVGGFGGSNTIAVHGLAGTGGTGGVGVRGECDAAAGVGVLGMSSISTGVRGESNSAGASDGNGVYGIVHHVGQTQVTAGVFGDSDASYGVIGRTTAAGYSGCTGIATTPNTAAFAGGAGSGAYAAYFSGATVVQGDFTVVGGQKNAAVRHTDGSYRLLHCVESPEPWFEDFGTAKLANGKAEVRLDADFAAVVDASDYLVFLTPEGDSRGLYITNKIAGGFAVREQQGGTSSLSFSWRVVARRKDIKVGRLEKFEVPKIRLPKPEELPKHP
jgi:hypothetical protein